jgi:hypothetical protein
MVKPFYMCQIQTVLRVLLYTTNKSVDKHIDIKRDILFNYSIILHLLTQPLPTQDSILFSLTPPVLLLLLPQVHDLFFHISSPLLKATRS